MTTPNDLRTGLDAETLARAVREHLFYQSGRRPETASLNDVYLAVAAAVRDRLFHRAVATVDVQAAHPTRAVAYLSAEFLMGPQLGANLMNLGVVGSMRTALASLGLDLYAVLGQEEEPGLGNGGLGRLSACYMDSLATLDVPAVGHGIRYEFGIFDQELRHGWQVEVADRWLRWGNPWEIARPDIAVQIGFSGSTQADVDDRGRYQVTWKPAEIVRGVPHDMPVLGYGTPHCNTLRLWRAEAVEQFDVSAFNQGDYVGAVEQRIRSESISKLLYPNDDTMQGKVLRLRQQVFFVSCALQDMLRTHCAEGGRPEMFDRRWAVQLNDTHPAVAVAELMRLLVDEHRLPWEIAWETTRRTIGYTNHTLLPEALETWPVSLFGSLLPRHLEIVYEINRRLLDDVRTRFPGDDALVARLSLIDDRGERRVRMANLACAGAHAINGVAALHSDLLAREVLADWHAVHPERFHNVTNGVTPRRFLALSNPGLAGLITLHLGDRWAWHLDDLAGLARLADDAGFQEAWRHVKHLNKVCLAELIADRTGVRVDPAALFDVHVKRIHEYKRQHLKVLHVLTEYLRIKDSPARTVVPRVFLFGGKAAPGYWMAKLIVRLITAAADVINADADVAGRLRVVFFPDFNVSNAQLIYPGADLSEQISLAGKEASGTGNMKMALNGALTIGTLDGANIEIRDAVGADHFFLFGLTAADVAARKAAGYRPRDYYEQDPRLARVVDLVASGALAGGDRDVFRPLVRQWLHDDPYMLMADYASFIEAQDAVSARWLIQPRWTHDAIVNVARSGWCSSDRAIREYCARIWKIEPGRAEPITVPTSRPRRGAKLRRRQPS
ncbi:glycogen/starch/alpha-glucan phosphorylase [Luteitalea sp.]|uniref:glycogen/starch/alpha-glucan phosphorylase n=1 Tax=Luteitalea sp. TaxID=2004800 RepID=UPI0025BCE22F|nr:glycogen/starch/alpha-glucan phosphorylase [Luteitalea sp.]